MTKLSNLNVEVEILINDYVNDHIERELNALEKAVIAELTAAIAAATGAPVVIAFIVASVVIDAIKDELGIDLGADFFDFANFAEVGFMVADDFGLPVAPFQAVQQKIFNGTDFDDNIVANDEDNELFGGLGSDTLQGGAGNDHIEGGDFADNLFGGSGNDSLYGGSGADLLVGGAGADNLYGGFKSGSIASYAESHARVIVDLLAGTGSGGHAEGDVLVEIDHLIGSVFDDIITGNNRSNLLVGGEGNDTIYGEDGDDEIFGGGGGDSIEGGAGDDTIYSGGGSSGFVFGESGNDEIFGGEGDEYLDGGMGEDIIFAGAGNDSVVGGLGADNLDGGDGWDALVYSYDPKAIDINLATGIARTTDNQLLIVDDTIANFEMVYGSAYNDTITGDIFSNHLRGGNGDDTFVASRGGDILDGDEGIDTLVFEGATSKAEVNLDGGALGEAGHFYSTSLGSSMLYEIENVTGTVFDDTLLGSDVDNVLKGEAGNDRLRGNAGKDTLDGGEGIDLVDYASFGTGFSKIDLVDGHNYNGVSGFTFGDLIWNQEDTLISIENVIGTGGNDTIIGSAVANDLDGYYGDDTLYGGGGDDTLRGGYGGNDGLYGDDGDDFLNGGYGDDQLFGGNGTDTAVYARNRNEYEVTDNGNGTITVHDINVLSVDEGTDTLVGIERIQFGDAVVDADQATTFAPTALTITGGTIGENATDGTVVATLAASDPDAGDTFAYSLAGDGSDLFEIIGDEIRVKDGAVIDFEMAGSHDLTVRATDSAGYTIDKAMTIAVADVNEAPTGITLTGGMMDENALPGTTVATLAAFDTDVGDSFTYALTSDPSGFFEILGEEVRVKAGAAIDFETAQSHDVTVEATDSAGNGFAQEFTLSVVDQAENPIESVGTGGNDILAGDGNKDLISGLAGNDTLQGHGGNDVLEGGAGADLLQGGAGTDTASYATSDSVSWGGLFDSAFDGVLVDLLTNGNSFGHATGDVLSDIENLTGSDYGDALLGDSGSNVLDGGTGGDIVLGRFGDDIIYGGAGDDTLFGDDASGFPDGTAGIDFGDDQIFGGAGNDNLFGEGGADFIDGGDDVDLVNYSTSPFGVTVDLVNGQGYGPIGSYAAGDTYANIENARGSEFDDILIGTTDANTLEGLDGDDLLIGSLGADILAGGAGTDSFAISSVDEGGDIIVDFDPNGEVLDLRTLFTAHGLSSTDPIGEGILQIAGLDGGSTHTIVNIDQDGFAGSEHAAVTLYTMVNVNPFDITLGDDILIG